jgi:LysM repeat protein
LMILAVLAAVGYGVYVSLSPNEGDSRSPLDPPTVDISNAKPWLTPGGPLPLRGNRADDSGTGSLAPPPLAGGPTSNPSGGATNPPVTPFSPPSLPSNNPTATLGPPTAPSAAPNLTPPIGSGPTVAVPPLPPDGQVRASATVRNLSPPPESGPNGSSPSSADKATEDLLQRQFTDVMDGVHKKLEEGKLAEAQLALSILYVNPNLPADQARQITELLDQLAGTVIYSRQSHIAPPYVVQSGDTIDRVAQKYKVPWQLLARINGLMPPGAPNGDETVKDQPLAAGKELKVVEGPFDAMVQLGKRQLTLMVHNRYAGRFPIGVGRDQPKLEGQFTVGDKKLNPTYYGPDGVTINPNDPKNPLGGAWIGLTDRIGIHGAADPQSVGRDDNRGTICVSDRDLQDLYGILSVGSRVTILR